MLLETERLIISEITLAEAPFLLELLNEPDYIKYIGDKNVKTIADAEKNIEEKYLVNYNKDGIAYYIVSLKNNNTTIGKVGLMDREGLDCVDIGYALLSKYRGKGYAFEATKTLLDFAQNDLKLHPIAAITTKDNTKSSNLLERLGMRFVKYIYIPNDPVELRLFMTE